MPVTRPAVRPTEEVHSHMLNHLLDDQIHNFPLTFPCGYLSDFQEPAVCYIWLHTVLYQSAIQCLSARTHTVWLHVNDTSSVVGLKGARHHPSDFTLLPSLSGASLSVFSFHNLRTYAHFQGEPTPSLMSRPCLFGFSQPFPVRRRGCRPVLPLYKLPCIVIDDPKRPLFFLLFNINLFDFVCQGPLFGVC